MVYLHSYEELEEAGTPNVCGAIRAGLAFKIKDACSDEMRMGTFPSLAHFCLHLFTSQAVTHLL